MTSFKEEHEFSSRGHLESNIEKLWRREIEEKNKQAVVIICGPPGTGKSVLTWWIDRYIRGEVSLKWWAFNHEEWMTLGKNRPKKKTVKYDEGRDTFFRRNAMKQKNKEGLDVLSQYRLLNNFHIINFQNLKDMELDVVDFHADLLLRVTHQGWLHGYGKRGRLGSVEKHKYKDKIKWPTPDFRDGFPDFSTRFPEVWEEYERENEDSLQVGDINDEDGEEESLNQRLEEAELVGVTKIADMLGVGPNTVYDWGEEGKIDMYMVNGQKKFDKKTAENVVEPLSD